MDARGLRCPWPALRLARALRDATAVRLLADDPAAPGEVAALAEARGWLIERPAPGEFLVIRGGNHIFTTDA